MQYYFFLFMFPIPCEHRHLTLTLIKISKNKPIIRKNMMMISSVKSLTLAFHLAFTDNASTSSERSKSILLKKLKTCLYQSTLTQTQLHNIHIMHAKAHTQRHSYTHHRKTHCHTHTQSACLYLDHQHSISFVTNQFKLFFCLYICIYHI